MITNFRLTQTFKNARKLTNRTEIAKAFNLEDRIVLRLELNADDYGDKGNNVKIATEYKGTISYLNLELRRFGDEDKIKLVNFGGMMLSSSFGLENVRQMFEEHNCQTIKNGDKCVILVEDRSNKCGFVLTGTINAPKYHVGYTYEATIELD